MHVVLYLPGSFYSAIASAFVETLQAVNDVSGSEVFTFEFVSRANRARSKSGIVFPAKSRPTRPMDVLVLLTGAGRSVLEAVKILEEESERSRSLILLARQQGALVAATCGASYILANLGLLNGRSATISWWLKKEAKLRFPLVRWQPSRILVRDGSFYTTGAAFAGLELISRLLIDLGFAKEERQVRKLMVLPPARESQDPYEVPGLDESTSFEKKLARLARTNLTRLDLNFLALQLRMTPRTLARRFVDESEGVTREMDPRAAVGGGSSLAGINKPERFRSMLPDRISGCRLLRQALHQIYRDDSGEVPTRTPTTDRCGRSVRGVDLMSPEPWCKAS